MSYTVEVGSPTSSYPVVTVATLTAARQHAESYGTTADWCHVYRSGKLVAAYHRDRSGNGSRWYKGGAA